MYGTHVESVQLKWKHSDYQGLRRMEAIFYQETDGWELDGFRAELLGRYTLKFSFLPNHGYKKEAINCELSAVRPLRHSPDFAEFLRFFSK
jgi:hypothetical protein